MSEEDRLGSGTERELALRERTTEAITQQSPRPQLPQQAHSQNRQHPRQAMHGHHGHAPHDGPCQHGHGDHGGHGGHGDHGGHGGHGGQRFAHGTDPAGQPNEHYFTLLKTTYSHNKLFFYREILNGNAFRQLLKRYRLSFLNRFDTSMFKHMLGAFLGFAAGDCLPDILRPFLAGLFIPMVIIFALSYHMIMLYKTFDPSIGEFITSFLLGLYSAVVLLFTLTALRGSGSLKNDYMQRVSYDLLKKKPFLKTPKAYCQECQVVKAFRTHHCPQCKSCIPKFSRHSLLLNQCIGAGNEILYMSLMFSLFIAQFTVLVEFTVTHVDDVPVSLGSKIAFYLINMYMGWLALSDFLTILIYVQHHVTQNLCFNITEYEIMTWMHQPYLVAYMKRQFFNPGDNGPGINFKESVYCMMGWQIESADKTAIFDEEASILSTGERTGVQLPIINWCKTIVYTPAQFPNHPNRREIAEKMGAMEVKLIEQMRMTEQVRKRVMIKYQGKATAEQIEYYIMMEMQAQKQKQMQKEVARMMEQSRQGADLTPQQKHQMMMMQRMQMMARMQQAQQQQQQVQAPTHIPPVRDAPENANLISDERPQQPRTQQPPPQPKPVPEADLLSDPAPEAPAAQDIPIELPIDTGAPIVAQPEAELP